MKKEERGSKPGEKKRDIMPKGALVKVGKSRKVDEMSKKLRRVSSGKKGGAKKDTGKRYEMRTKVLKVRKNKSRKERKGFAKFSTTIKLKSRKRLKEWRKRLGNSIRRVKGLRRKMRGSWRKVVTYLVLGLMFLVGLYLVLAPIFPAILFHIRHLFDQEEIPYITQLDNVEGIDLGNFKRGNRPIPEENRLVIPWIGVDHEIVEGENSKGALMRGIWHQWGTGDPVKGGNFVLSGHRMAYAWLPEEVKNAQSFYNLNKLEKGDFVIVYWEGREYDYRVVDYFYVVPEDISILDPSEEHKLTLYTCGAPDEGIVPSNEQRYVVVAEPYIVDTE